MRTQSQSVRCISILVGLMVATLLPASFAGAKVSEISPLSVQSKGASFALPGLSQNRSSEAPGLFTGPRRKSVDRDTRIPGRYIVVFKDSVENPANLADTQVHRRGGQLGFVYRRAIKGYSAKLSKQAVEALREDPRVKYVTPDRRVEIQSQTTPTGIERVLATENELADIDGEDDARVHVDVAVIDSGVDQTHTDLNVYARANCVPAGEGFEDEEELFAEQCVENSGTDGHGHGTHVAGTVGAIDNEKGVVGVAPGARIWSARVIADDGYGAESWILAGVDWVKTHANEIEVANMSVGCSCTMPALDEAIDAAVEAGVVFAVAAQNSGLYLEVGAPAANPNVITVGALADYDGAPGGEAEPSCASLGDDDALAWFSNFGALVELIAPGTCILSTVPGGYGLSSGTSMAAPHVAGAAALLAGEENPQDQEDVEAIRDELIDASGLDFEQSVPGEVAPLLYIGDKSLTTELLTGSPLSIKARSAELTGAVNARGLETTYQFEIGTDTSYGTTIPVKAGKILAGAGFTRVAEVAAELTPDTKYHFRLVVTNSEGTFEGADRSFTTGRSVLTLAPEDVAETSASLVGAVNEAEFHEAGETTWRFEYGPTLQYGETIEAEAVSGSLDATFDYAAAEITDLDQLSTYHYRFVVENAYGIFPGRDQAFRTGTWAVGAGSAPPPSHAYYEGVSCPSPEMCVATGSGVEMRDGGGEWDTEFTTSELKEFWSTTKAASAHDVSCVSEDSCMAIGRSGSAFCIVCGGQGQTYAAEWDGSEWVSRSVPKPPDGAGGAYLTDVSCASEDFCMAVGRLAYAVEGIYIKFRSWAAQWNGSEWSLMSLSKYMSDAELADVACVGEASCVVVGGPNPSWDYRPLTGLAVQWAEGTWTPMELPQGTSGLGSVSCPTSSWCMATEFEGGALRWDEGEWSHTPFDDIGQEYVSVLEPFFDASWGPFELADVSCVSESACVAVGGRIADLEANREPIVLRWDGAAWSNEGFAEPGYEYLWAGGVSCVSVTRCTAAIGQLIREYDYELAAKTGQAVEVGPEDAMLEGEVNPKLLPTTYQFEYGATTAYGSKAPASPKSIGSGTDWIGVEELVEGLQPGSEYHFRVVATNSLGTTYGDDEVFHTPGVSTGDAKEITGVGATLSGEAHPGGVATSVQFQVWDEDEEALPPVPPMAGSIGSGTGWVPINWSVKDLKPGSEYYFRLVATSAAGTYYGAKESFVTPAAEFLADEYPAIIRGTADPEATNLLSFSGGSSCSTALEGVELAPGEPAMALDAKYCASGNQMDMNGCEIVFRPWEEVAESTFKGDLKLGPAECGPLRFSSTPNALSCGALEIDPHAPFDAEVQYENLGEGEGAHVAVTALIESLDATTESCGGGSAKWEATWVLSAVSEEENPTGLAVQTVSSLRPEVVAKAASEVTSSSATLNATVDPHGLETEYRFEYATQSSNVFQALEVESAGSGTGPVALEEDLGGLSPGAPYHYRISATNEEGTHYSEPVSFTTLGAKPSANTVAASDVSTSGATLNALVNSNHLATTYQFEYGETESYGAKVPASPGSAGSGGSAVGVDEEVEGLQANTVYHYRVVVTNALGTAYGTDQAFKTALDSAPVLALELGSFGSGNGQFSAPGGLDVDAEGNVWVADGPENYRVQRLDSEGEYLSQVETPEAEPTDVAVGVSGDIWVNEPSNERIGRYSPQGEFLDEISIASPSGLFGYLDENEESVLWVARGGTPGWVTRYYEGGGGSGYGAKYSEGLGSGFSPGDVAVDSQGDVWAVDVMGGRLVEWPKNSNYPQVFAEEGGGEGELAEPRGIAIDADDNIYVADTGNNRVQIFDEEGNYLTEFGSYGGGEGEMSGPTGIAVAANGSIWVSDSGNSRVQKWEGG